MPYVIKLSFDTAQMGTEIRIMDRMSKKSQSKGVSSFIDYGMFGVQNFERKNQDI